MFDFSYFFWLILIPLLIFSYANKVGAIHFQTSAKLNKGVEEMFLTLTQRMLEHAAEQEEKTATLTRTNSQRRNVVVVEDDQVTQPSSKNCCGTGWILKRSFIVLFLYLLTREWKWGTDPMLDTVIYYFCYYLLVSEVFITHIL